MTRARALSGERRRTASDDDGQTWFQVSDASLPSGPVVSIIYRDGVLYASVWAGASTKRQPRGHVGACGRFPAGTHVYRIQFSPTGVLHCVVAASRRNGFVDGGLYVYSGGQWNKLTSGLEQLLLPARLAPMDFAFDPARPGVIYLCAATIRNSNGGGGAYRFDGSKWARYNIPFPSTYSSPLYNITQAFAPVVMATRSISPPPHTASGARPSLTIRPTQEVAEFAAVPFLGTQRLTVADRDLYITTLGNGVWKVPASETRLLWNNTDGRASLWSLSHENGGFKSGTDMAPSWDGASAAWPLAWVTSPPALGQYGRAREPMETGLQRRSERGAPTGSLCGMDGACARRRRGQQDPAPVDAHGWAIQSMDAVGRRRAGERIRIRPLGGMDGERVCHRQHGYRPRLLWTHSSGRIRLWTLSSGGGGIEGDTEYGPYNGGRVPVWRWVRTTGRAFCGKPPVAGSACCDKFALCTPYTSAAARATGRERVRLCMRRLTHGWGASGLAVGEDNKNSASLEPRRWPRFPVDPVLDDRRI
jgi:hypothetical protein